MPMVDQGYHHARGNASLVPWVRATIFALVELVVSLLQYCHKVAKGTGTDVPQYWLAGGDRQNVFQRASLKSELLVSTEGVGSRKLGDMPRRAKFSGTAL
jgi:hypothetical protein